MLAKPLSIGFIATLFLLLFANCSYAKDKTHISGFGSIVGYQADGRDLGFRSNISSSRQGRSGDIELLELSLVGLQVNYQINSKWELVTQAVVRHEQIEDLTDRIKLATINYTPNAEWLIRLGRFFPKIYLLSDTRYIGYAQDTAYPVVDFYAQIPLASLDGVDIGYQTRAGKFLFTANAYSGTSEVWADIDGSNVKTPLKDIHGVNFGVEFGNWLFRAGYTVATHDGFDTDTEVEMLLNLLASPPPALGIPGWPGAQDMLQAYRIKNTDFSYSSLAFEYSEIDSYWRGELGKLATDSFLAPDSVAGYIQYTKRVGKVSPFVIVSAIDTKKGYTPRDLPPPELLHALSVALQQDLTQPFHLLRNSLNIGYKQHSLIGGVRIDWDEQIAIKAQYERKWVGDGGAGLWQRDPLAPIPDRVANIMTLGIDWVF
ncbi:hypothetical protein ACMZOO_13240 [Catenovulum sp. SX2]|uniref:hypothetical protein n=1 Tax=Catenovulum sp. SX2 TaxID=3398614 RepID=UPI003F87AF41